MYSGDIPFKHIFGYWKWDNNIKSTVFISNVPEPPNKLSAKSKKHLASSINIVPASKHETFNITFRDIDLLDKNKFNKYFQRKFGINDPPVVILQDVKDVVLYSIDPKHLTLEMIEYLHTPIIDRFFKALIIYFQFHFQVWHRLLIRRELVKCHVWHPQVIKVENQIRDDLADLRSMVSKEYAALLRGIKEATRFHHMPDKSYPLSFSKRDKRLNEILIQVSVKIVWVALSRPNISHIEMELDRLTRTNTFNRFLYRGARTKTFATSENESRILRGTGDVVQKRFVSQSPLIKEALYSSHDPRMLAIGQKTFPVNDNRIRYLEAAYTAPEEKLHTYGIKIGILGIPRNEFDIMLKQKCKQSDDETVFKKEPVLRFQMPPCDPDRSKTLPHTYPKQLPKLKISVEKQKILNKQYNMWKNYVRQLND